MSLNVMCIKVILVENFCLFLSEEGKKSQSQFRSLRKMNKVRAFCMSAVEKANLFENALKIQG